MAKKKWYRASVPPLTEALLTAINRVFFTETSEWILELRCISLGRNNNFAVFVIFFCNVTFVQHFPPLFLLNQFSTDCEQ